MKNEICKPANNLLISKLYTLDNTSELVEASIDSLTIYYVGYADSLVYDNQKSVGEINLPLSDTATFLQVVVKMNEFTDTISIDYKAIEVFRSVECGVINRYTINNIEHTKNKLWELYLYNNQVDESKEANIFLVFRPH
ncbi:MAG: hypothetical protein B7C24_07385 [Bacteroidetes bacterium 4572_77]|nr:MAG: hypothetical protein B7C24_07385 [Bacteroidetes bacterium 4572_77]